MVTQVGITQLFAWGFQIFILRDMLIGHGVRSRNGKDLDNSKNKNAFMVECSKMQQVPSLTVVRENYRVHRSL